MAVSPRIVTEDRNITWDGVSQRLPKGQVLDVPPDSPLERAIGADYLVPLRGAAAPQVPAPEAAEQPAAEVPSGKPQQEDVPSVPPKPVAPAKKQASAKDGDAA